MYCFHQNCQTEIDQANYDIRAAWRYFQPEASAEEKQALLEASSRKHELESRALAAKPTILASFAWNPFGSLELPMPKQFELWKSLWEPGNVIWCGEPHHSGEFFHRGYFTTAEEAGLRGHFTCASHFRSGTYSRANSSVLATPFLIVEGDQMIGEKIETDEHRVKNKLACCAVFNWLRKEMGLALRCVVDSGNKSAHGWFNMPDRKTFDQLKVMLPILGCDPAMFKPSQPARVPGIHRENSRPQQLIYFS